MHVYTELLLTRSGSPLTGTRSRSTYFPRHNGFPWGGDTARARSPSSKADTSRRYALHGVAIDGGIASYLSVGQGEFI